ncbi:hypothetical protein GGR51DRAFT_568538 [Nemania sp. FL0031]|nr:hypothetical protein GGR51DRAFT_568538 [Nemania sp. FL0031]
MAGTTDVHDILVDLGLNIYIVAKQEKQQEQEPQTNHLDESTITPPHHYRLEAGIVRKALHAFAVVFTFDNSGDQVTAAMLRDETEGPGRSSQVTVYVAKNSGTCAQDDKLRKILCGYFNNRRIKKFEDTDRHSIFSGCSKKIDTDITRSFKTIKSAREILSRKLEDHASWEHTSAGIVKLLENVVAYHSKKAMKQAKLLKTVSDWVENNKMKIEEFCDSLTNDAVFTEDETDDVKSSLGLLGDLCRLDRALEDFKIFKEGLGCLTELSISFVQPQHSDDLSVDNDMRERLCDLRLIYPGSWLPSPPIKARTQLDIHCEIQLLTHFHDVLNKEGANMWKYIACSKLPCFCCYHFLKTGSEFSTEESHFAVYSPWAIPKKLADEARSQLEAGNPVMIDSLGDIRDRLGKRVYRNPEINSWEKNKAICQNPRIHNTQKNR